MQLSIRHTTTYRYDSPVVYALQKVRLRPQSAQHQKIEEWSVKIEGGVIEADYLDHHGNHVDLVNVDRDAQVITITASGTVQTLDNHGILGHVYGQAPLWHFAQPTPATTPNQEILDLIGDLPGAADKIDALHRLSARVIAAIPYRIGATGSDTTAAEAMAAGAGVCQDHAQVFVTVARAAGMSARYISGYLMMDDRIDQDATHAWAEVHIDGLGWVGFDVSNGISPDERYVRIASGCDARDAAPTQGLRVGDAGEHMIVSLQVQQ